MAIAVGSLSLDPPVLLAPMAGITDRPFRDVVRRFGAGLVVSEMVASQEMVLAHRGVRARAALGGGMEAVQIAGREAHWMAEAARMVEAEGAPLIDINMGCPAKKVTGGASGSALMRDPDHGDGVDRGGGGCRLRPRDAEVPAGLGRRDAQRGRARAARGGGGRRDGHRARTHAMPVLPRPGGLGRGPGGQGGRSHPRRRQRGRARWGLRPRRARGLGGGRRDDRARRAGGALAAGRGLGRLVGARAPRARARPGIS